MIPFSDPGTHVQLARFRIDDMLKDASDHRLVRANVPERPHRHRLSRIRRLLRIRRPVRRRTLAS